MTNVYFDDQENIIAERTGVVLNQSHFFQIFIQPDLVYVPLHKWRELSENELDGKWTVELGTTPTIIVTDVTDYEFNFDTLANITNAERDFLLDTPDAMRIASIDANLHGTRMSQHISVRA